MGGTAPGAGRRGRAAFLLLPLLCGFLLGRFLREEALPSGLLPSPAEPRAASAPAPVPHPPEAARLLEENRALRERAALEVESAAPSAAPAAPPPPAPDFVDRLESPVRVAGDSGDPKTGTLRVIGTDADGRPAAGIEVSLGRWGGETLTSTTDANGIAEFPGLPLGSVSVTSKAPGWTGVVSAWARPGRIVEVSLALRRWSVVEGRVTHAARGPLAAIRVMLVREGGAGAGELTATTDAEGRYRFEAVPEGRWTVRLHGDAVGFTNQSRGEFAVGDGRPVARDFLVGAKGLSGTVKDRTTGRPLAGVSVRIQSGGPFRMTDTDAEGRYGIADVATGTYGVDFYVDGYVQETVKGVHVGAEGGVLDAELTPTGTLALLVRDAEGNPVTGNLEFTWLLRDDPRSPSWGARRPADETGRVALRTLAPGAYRMTIAVPGLGSRTFEVDLGQGETTVEVRLEKRE